MDYIEKARQIAARIADGKSNVHRIVLGPDLVNQQKLIAIEMKNTLEDMDLGINVGRTAGKIVTVEGRGLVDVIDIETSIDPDSPLIGGNDSANKLGKAIEISLGVKRAKQKRGIVDDGGFFGS